VSPTFDNIEGLRFYYYMYDLRERSHVHEGKGASDRDAKIWLDNLEVATAGRFNKIAIKKALRIVRENQVAWLKIGGQVSKTTVNYPVKYRYSDYTFPTEARIERVEFNDTHMMNFLKDGRLLGVPLSWIPTLANATPDQRATYFLGDEYTTIHWSPEDGINEDLRLSSYLK
jgi:hypothetical protein